MILAMLFVPLTDNVSVAFILQQVIRCFWPGPPLSFKVSEAKICINRPLLVWSVNGVNLGCTFVIRVHFFTLDIITLGIDLEPLKMESGPNPY